jgi:hypothetical protein
VLIRPHPERQNDWAGVELGPFGNVALHGRNPLDADAKADYFDALTHASAAVGLVTSAFLEAGIAGAPVYTLLLPEFRPHQEGMRHFTYLMETEGGLLCAARTFAEHFRQLERAIEGRADRKAQTEKFLRAFIRPHGLQTRATDVFVREIEAAGKSPAPVRSDVAWLRPLTQPATVWLSAAVSGSPWLMDPIEYRDALTTAEALDRKHAQREGKELDKRRRTIRKRRKQVIAGLKTAAKRAMGMPLGSQSPGRERPGR